MKKRLLILVTYANLFLLGIYLSTYQISLIRIAAFYGLEVVMIGFIVSVQYVGIFLPPLFIGTLSGRYGKKKVLYVAYLLLIAGSAWISFGADFTLFCVALVLTGAGYSVLEGTTSAVLSDEFPEKSRFHISMSQVVFSVGAMTGPIICDALFKAGLTFQDLFLMVAALFLLVGLGSIFTKHEARAGAPAEKQPLYGSFRLFKTAAFVFLALSLLLYVGIEEIIAFYADSYFKLSVGSPESGAIALSLYWGMMISSRFLGGILKIKTRTIVTFSSVLLGISLVGIVLLPGAVVKILMFLTAGFASGPIWPMIMDSAAKRYSDNTGPVLNILMSMCGFGGIALPFIAGLVISFSDYGFAYIFAAAAAICVFASYLGFTRKSKTLM